MMGQIGQTLWTMLIDSRYNKFFIRTSLFCHWFCNILFNRSE